MTRSGRWKTLIVALVALHGVALGLRTCRDAELQKDPLGLRVRQLGSGGYRSLAQIADGRPLLLVFWTTWCEYCAEELERGADLAESLSAGSAPAGVLFVNVGEHASVVASHPAATRLRDRIGLDLTGEVARVLGVRGFPSRVLLGSGGEVLWTAEGYDPTADQRLQTRPGVGGHRRE
jgi:thiol-disulfide isomerase/thioredoxin